MALGGIVVRTAPFQAGDLVWILGQCMVQILFAKLGRQVNHVMASKVLSVELHDI